MKSIHLVYSFPPDPIGGTEVYVERLCRDLIAAGDEAVVVAPGAREARYLHQGIKVQRFAVDQAGLAIESLYDDGDTAAADAFAAILRKEAPDVVHQHALTAACSVASIARAKAAGLPVVFTYHTPTVTCTRGTLLEFGERVCDGRVEADRCAACTLQGHGVPQWASQVLAHVPATIGRGTRQIGLGSAGTALGMRDLMERRAAAVRRLVGAVDRFVVLTPWVEGVLRANGVASDKLFQSPHGVSTTIPSSDAAPRPAGPLRLVHLGRVDPAKGTRVLIDAIRAMPAAALTLDVFGIVQGSAAERHASDLLRAAESDPRIRFRAPIAHDDVVPALAAYDLVAVPSQWMETGPLVVLEAFAAGVPVIGSALGGIADKVRPDVDGVLVTPFNSREAWRAAIERLVQDPSHVHRLRTGVRAPRSMASVVAEMGQLYRLLAA
jgi:glycosyltransferase involved in cell wall biosynthesis